MNASLPEFVNCGITKGGDDRGPVEEGGLFPLLDEFFETDVW